MTRNYKHSEVSGAAIDSKTDLLTVTTRGRDTVTIIVRADTSSTFRVDVDTGDGFSEGYKQYSSVSEVNDTLDLAVDRVMIRNTAAQTASDTADVEVGAL